MTIPDEHDRLLVRARAHERAGEWQAALDLYESAFQSRVTRTEPVLLLDLITRVGQVYRQAGRTEVASELLDLALVLADLHNQDGIAARALNGLAILKQTHGDIAGAELAYMAARDRAIAAGDSRPLGEIEQNLGIISTIRGNFQEAMDRYTTGLQHLQRAGHDRGCASVLANLGMLHVDMGRLDEADSFFQRSLDICERISDVVLAGAVHINRTEMFLARGQPDRARESCDEAFEIFSRLGERDGKAEAMKFYGIIHRTLNKPHLAESYLRQAIQIGEQDRYPLVAAESYRELAFVLRALERNREALEALNHAHSLFVGLQAKSDLADIRQRITQLESDFLLLVRFWGESIEAKDRYTSGHCERVAEYACRLAREVGFEEPEIVWFRMGAFLHDLGKTEVPEEILNKPGRLTEEERATMERHTIAGDEMLTPVEFPWDVRPMVRSHHERWDGTGYPDRIGGEQIPLSARVLRVADIFDALTTARSYREPLTPEQAFAMMEADEGSFDPAIFEVFRRLFPEFVESAREAAKRVAVEASEPPKPPPPPQVRSTKVV